MSRNPLYSQTPATDQMARSLSRWRTQEKTGFHMEGTVQEERGLSYLRGIQEETPQGQAGIYLEPRRRVFEGKRS